MGYYSDLYGELHLNKVLTKKHRKVWPTGVADNLKGPDGWPLFCSWIPTKKGTGIIWNESGDFDDIESIEELKSVITKFLAPDGYVVNGIITWHGDCRDEDGAVRVKDNIVVTKKLRLVDDEGNFYD